MLSESAMLTNAWFSQKKLSVPTNIAHFMTQLTNTASNSMENFFLELDAFPKNLEPRT